MGPPIVISWTMKNVPLNEAELLEWIATGTEECLTVDYKKAASLGRDSKRTAEIAKDVSALANSAGGLLFYGIPEAGHVPGAPDPITDPTITKEWLEQTISTGIHPRILDIRIHPIRLSQPTGGSVYVVEVPEGITAHQAVVYQKYYRRFNFESVPMHDREIRDVMGRHRDPVVDVTAKLKVGPAAEMLGVRTSQEHYRWLKLGLENVGTRMAHEVHAFIHIPLALLDRPEKMIPFPRVHETPHGPIAVIQITNKTVDGDGPLAMPVKIEGSLLPGLSLHVKTIRLISTDTPLPANTLVVMQVYADEAQARTQTIHLHDLEPKPQ